jgi:formamidopyrimidine-DNA glycosylase
MVQLVTECNSEAGAIMPELPEVETTRRRLEPLLKGKQFDRVVMRVAKLRLPLSPELATVLPGQTVKILKRRGKYLLVYCDHGCLVIHLGMTGFLRLVPVQTPPGSHDHLDMVFTDGWVLRFHDPRKFGIILWMTDDPLYHPLLSNIGPEPLEESFAGEYLFDISRSRRVAVKQLIMNSSVIAGVGNIYANEALFRAGIRPDRAAGSLDREECHKLAQTIREVLTESIETGSTYRVAEETVAYHPLTLMVYGRSGTGCRSCGEPLETTRLGNRSTVFCSQCQH